MVTLSLVVLTLIGLCGHYPVQAGFKVFRGDEVDELVVLSDVEKLAVAARTGETHTVELTDPNQAGVVQEGVSISIDCLPLLSQSSHSAELSLKWTSVQLDQSGEIIDSSLKVHSNDDNVPQPRITVGGERNRWLNITSTVSYDQSLKPDSKIFTCELCKDFSGLEGCNTSVYTQFVVGTLPQVRDTSDKFCISMETNTSKGVSMKCEIINSPQPTPMRSWYKDGFLVYSEIHGLYPDLTEFLLNNPVLVTGVLDPIIITALRDGTIFYNYEVKNITFPALLPVGTTLTQAEQQVFQHLLGNWTCTVSNILGLSTITYRIRECEKNNVSFEKEFYTAGEEDGYTKVCIVTSGSIDFPEVKIDFVVQGVNDSSAATDESDFVSEDKWLWFNTTKIEKACINITIVDDDFYEGQQQFVVKFGNLPNAQAEAGFIQRAHVTIVDDEIPVFAITPSSITVFENVSRVEVCVTSQTKFEREVIVEAQIDTSNGTANNAEAGSDYISPQIILTFLPSEEPVQRFCRNIKIIDNHVPNEPEKQFTIALISASPSGTFIEGKSLITIIDNDDYHMADATFKRNMNRTIILSVIGVAILIIVVSVVVTVTVILILVVTVKRKSKAKFESKKSEDTSNQVVDNSKRQEEIKN